MEERTRGEALEGYQYCKLKESTAWKRPQCLRTFKAESWGQAGRRRLKKGPGQGGSFGAARWRSDHHTEGSFRFSGWVSAQIMLLSARLSVSPEVAGPWPCLAF